MRESLWRRPISPLVTGADATGSSGSSTNRGAASWRLVRLETGGSTRWGVTRVSCLPCSRERCCSAHAQSPRKGSAPALRDRRRGDRSGAVPVQRGARQRAAPLPPGRDVHADRDEPRHRQGRDAARAPRRRGAHLRHLRARAQHNVQDGSRGSQPRQPRSCARDEDRRAPVRRRLRGPAHGATAITTTTCSASPAASPEPQPWAATRRCPRSWPGASDHPHGNRPRRRPADVRRHHARDTALFTAPAAR